MNKNSYGQLIGKLDEFIRKYYKNQLIRGLIYAATFTLAFYLFFILLEHIGHFGIGVRTAFFYTYVLVCGTILTRFVFIPLAKINKLGSIISHEQAAQIVGNHFPEVSDKLINTLQLNKAAEQSPVSDLFYASIDQKISELSPVPFSMAVDLGENRRYLKYLAIPVMALLLILVTAPGLITQSTVRLMEHRTFFEKPHPFSFIIKNDNLDAVQYEDFRLDVEVVGEQFPDQAFIEIGDVKYRLEKENPSTYHYQFRNLQGNTTFTLTGAGYTSKEYLLKAIPNPSVLDFNVQINYPAYLGKSTENLKNAGDLIIPEGTKITWNFRTRNTDKMAMTFPDTSYYISKTGNSTFSLARTFRKNTTYAVSTSNQFMDGKDSILYSLTVIPDLFPGVEFEQQNDSVLTKRIFFRGIIRDDYGFNKLTFNYQFLDNAPRASTQKGGGVRSLNVPINNNSNREQFFYMWDLAGIQIDAGQQLEYYFEVWDNDGVNGPKSVRSQTMLFKAPTSQELAEKSARSNEEIKSDLKESMTQVKKLQRDINDLQKKMLDKKELGWEDKKRIEDLLKSHKNLEQKLQNSSREYEKTIKQQGEYRKMDEDILDKHKQLQELMDKVMTDEIRKLMEDLEKMLSELDRQKLQEQMEQMKMDHKDVLKELERSLEMFKQIEFEQKLKEAINNLERLAKDQEKLSKETQEKNKSNEELKANQQELKKDFDELKKELKDLEKKNSEMQYPKDFDNPEKDQQSVQEEMKNAEQQLDEKQNKKASESQKKASDKMKEMAQKMSQQSAQSAMQQDMLDLDAIRDLLENLIKLSFDQERVMQTFKDMNVNDPRYVKVTQEQRNLRDDAKMIEDSLFALSKRVSQIQSVVNKEMSSINNNMGVAIQNLQDRQTPQARSRQQFSMTSINNLALMLSEVLDAMQQDMASSMSGQQVCQKRGNKKQGSSASKMQQLQQQLNEQMKKMQEKMKSGGQTPGGNKGMSEGLARLAAQQEAIRQELQRLSQEYNKDGKGTLGNLDEVAKKMEQTETDLVNKRITQETLKRQEEILTRLLEAEKAERERDQEERREAREGKNIFNRNPSEFEEYKRQKMKETELLRTVPPSLNPYYRKKVSDYFQSINY